MLDLNLYDSKIFQKGDKIMKTWQRPAAVGQKFAANDYVSACSIKVTCDVHAKIPGYGYGVAIPDGLGFDGGVYFPCDEEYVVTKDQLTACTFTDTTMGPGENAPLYETADVYYWIGTNSKGQPNFHATTSTTDLRAALADSNKS